MRVTKIIVKKIRKNNKEVFKKLFEEYYDFLVMLSFFIVKDKRDAEDIVMMFFSELSVKVDSFKKGDFDSWIQKCIKNASLTFLKKSKRVIYDTDLVENYSLKNLNYFSWEIFEGLSEFEEEIIKKEYIEGYKQREILLMKNITKYQFLKVKQNAISKIKKNITKDKK